MMAAAPRGLGKGLGALIPTEAPANNPSVRPASRKNESTTPLTYLEIPIDTIAPNPVQPRTVFDEEALDELVFSIKTIGVRSVSGSYLKLPNKVLFTANGAKLPIPIV